VNLSAIPRHLDVRRLGLDLDNTLIDYTASCKFLAPTFGIDGSSATRDEIRRQLRHPDNDEEWQRFQSLLYTDGLDSALPASGSVKFLRGCKSRGIEVFIVSHKTQSGPERFGARNLRAPALHWLTRHNLVPSLIPEDRVFFADSMEAKVESIASLRLDIFVDDLLDVLSHPKWPSSTLGLRYSATSVGYYSPNTCVDFSALNEWMGL
jgi:hypothetical protein